MDSKTHTQIDKIKKVSRYIKTICRALKWVSISVLFCEAMIIVIGPVQGKYQVNGIDVPLNLLTSGAKVILIFILCLYFSVLLKGLHHMAALFSLFAEGNIFIKKSIGQIKQLGITVLFAVAANLAAFPLNIVVLNSISFEHINMSYSFPVGNIITGCFVILISWIMEVGREMREEIELTI
jgi:hypothetical protein